MNLSPPPPRPPFQSTSPSARSSRTLNVSPVEPPRPPSPPTSISHFRLVLSHSLVTPAVLSYSYPGSGTQSDPYIVEFIPNDPRNPMHFSQTKKWAITILVSIATLAVAFASSAYTGPVAQITTQFSVSDEIFILGVALFVLGFAVGPLFWAPLSELYGRQAIFILTYGMLTAFNAGAAGAQNIQTLIILRFFAGAFGSSPLTNTGGVIADIFPASQRGLVMAGFASAPFMGPVLGPIVGGFVGETVGWRWVEGVMAIFTGVLWIVQTALLPETYAPVLLTKRAAELSRQTGKVYLSTLEAAGKRPSPTEAFKKALGRPWVLLLREPIVLLLSIYLAIVYGTLYMMFSAFPIVYQQYRGWSEGIGGLAFLGVAVGMILAVLYMIPENARYNRVAEAAKASGEYGAPPEARLSPAMVGSLCLPIGLFWFAWTNGPSVHFMVSIIAGAPFGFGMVLVFVSVFNYLIDAYTIYAASTLAANSVLRSLFGAAFPLFASYMYKNLGIHWASSIPAFLALMCTPFPFLFYKYGPAIRKRCRFGREAAEALDKMMAAEGEKDDGSEASNVNRHSRTSRDSEVVGHEKQKNPPQGSAAEEEEEDARRRSAVNEKDVEKGAA